MAEPTTASAAGTRMCLALLLPAAPSAPPRPRSADRRAERNPPDSGERCFGVLPSAVPPSKPLSGSSTAGTCHRPARAAAPEPRARSPSPRRRALAERGIPRWCLPSSYISLIAVNEPRGLDHGWRRARAPMRARRRVVAALPVLGRYAPAAPPQGRKPPPRAPSEIQQDEVAQIHRRGALDGTCAATRTWFVGALNA